MITYFSWWYGQGLVGFWRAIEVMTEKVFSFFSINLLLRTLFDPWKRDISHVENASLDIVFKIFLDNLVSRLIGAICRFFIIIIGLIITMIFFLVLLSVFFIWILLPIIAVFLIFNGARMVLNG